MTEQQFTSQELAKLKAADPDDDISVRVRQIAELIEQKERLIEQNEQLIEQNKQLLAKDVRSEEEKAEYRSKIAVLEQRNSDLERNKKLNSSNSSKPPSSDGLSKETVDKKPKRTITCAKNPIASLVVNLVTRERPWSRLIIRTRLLNIFLTSARGVVRRYRSQM